MRTLIKLATMATLLSLAVSSFNSALAADSVRDAVDRGNRAFIAAYAAHDSAKIATLYAPDAAAFPPGAERANGREAIRKVWQGAMDAGITNVTVRTVDVVASGNLASETGEYALDVPGKDGKIAHVTGKYVVVWKRTKGVWQLYRDIWNDTPAH
jgi:uncharacterized protein (TIGR02246 family)